MTWRLFWRLLLALALTLFTLIVLLLAALWAANRQDDPLLPELARLTRFAPPAPPAMRRNGYFALIALNAPADESPQLTGERIFSEQARCHLRRISTYTSARASSCANTADAAPGRYPPTLQIPRELLCPNGADCAAHYAAHAPAIDALLAQQQTVLRRYQAVLQAPAYEEIVVPDLEAPLPHYRDWRMASEMLGMQAARLLPTRPEQALRLLVTNARIHQRLLAGSRNLMSGMSLLAMQVRHQRLISDLLRQRPALAARHLSAWQDALQAPAFVLEPALRGEIRWVLGALTLEMTRQTAGQQRLLPSDTDISTTLFELLPPWLILPNATLNSQWRNYCHALEQALQPPNAPAQAAATATSCDQPVPGAPEIAPWLQNLRNLLGTGLALMSGGHFPDYAQRAHDAEGHRRMVLLQLHAYARRVPLPDMPAWLQTTPPEWRNPYTQTPFAWDAAQSSLIFEGRQRQTQNADASATWRVPLGRP